MRFSVDAHAIGRHLTGNEVYVRNLLNGFASLDGDSDFVAYYSVNAARVQIPKRFKARQVASNPFLRLGLDLGRAVRMDRPDLLHVQYTAPVNCSVPIVASVHDVSFLHHPEFFMRARAWQLRVTVSRTVRSAARILTGSEFSRDTIVRAYDVDPGRVAVVPNAASSDFRPISRERAAVTVRQRFGVAAPFILSVGDLQPRKNQIGLIEAFARTAQAIPEKRFDLVLAGKQTWFAPKVREAAAQSGFAGRIHFTGFVTDRELIDLYNASEFFVFPSFYEGFGLPVLEAMACGRAVACSNTTAVPEVADGAAVLFDPHSPEEMSRALRDLILLPDFRVRLERLGLQRSTQFSWQETARKTLEIYYDVAGRSRPVPRKLAMGPSLT